MRLKFDETRAVREAAVLNAPPEPPDQQRDASAGAPAALPVLPPLTALAEIVVLFALIYGLDQLTPNLSILDLSPHPFWIPVLLVSLQYGTVSGFMAAAVAIALSLFAGLPEQDIGENLFAYFLRVFGQPILWIGVALLVGQFRMRQLEAKQELRLANQALTGQRDHLARHADQLRARVEQLEQELAARFSAPPHALAAVLADGVAAGGLGPAATRQEVLQAIASALFPDAVITAYRLEQGGLSECAVTGRKPDTGPRIRIGESDRLFAAVIGEGATVSVLDRAGEETLAGAGLAAVPIPAGEADGPGTATAAAGGRHSPFGMLVIESGDPDAITPDGLKALRMLAHALTPRSPQPRQQTAPAVRPHHRTLARSLATIKAVPKPPAAPPPPAAQPHTSPDRRASLIARLSAGPQALQAAVTINTHQSGSSAGAEPRQTATDHSEKMSSES